MEVWAKQLVLLEERREQKWKKGRNKKKWWRKIWVSEIKLYNGGKHCLYSFPIFTTLAKQSSLSPVWISCLMVGQSQVPEEEGIEKKGRENDGRFRYSWEHYYHYLWSIVSMLGEGDVEEIVIPKEAKGKAYEEV